MPNCFVSALIRRNSQFIYVLISLWNWSLIFFFDICVSIVVSKLLITEIIHILVLGKMLLVLIQSLYFISLRISFKTTLAKLSSSANYWVFKVIWVLIFQFLRGLEWCLLRSVWSWVFILFLIETFLLILYSEIRILIPELWWEVFWYPFLCVSFYFRIIS